jgi:F-type H+-transporting ATPase subunit a
MATETHEEVETHEGGLGVPEALVFHGKWAPVYYSGSSFSIILILALLGATRLKKVPGKLQGAWEFLYEWLHDAVISIMGEKGLPYFPLFFCFFVYIFFANLLGLIPGMASGTASLDTAVALTVITFLSTHVIGMWKKGVFGYWGHFFNLLDASQEKGPIKVIMLGLQYIMLPVIEIIGELARPLSLSMRLFGNIYAKEVLLTMLAAMVLQFSAEAAMADKMLVIVPVILRPAILVLGVLVSLIQAVVFTALSMVYISGAMEMHEDHDSDHQSHDDESTAGETPVAA